MNRKQLIIEITESRMAAFVSSDGTLAPLAERICTNRSDEGYKQTLRDLVDDCGDLNGFEAYSCSFSDPKCTLVPMSLFSESTPEALLGLTVQEQLPKGETDYNRLPEWNIVNVYYLPSWVKSVLILKAPRIVIQHELTHLLRFLNTGSSVPLRTHFILQENHFCCVVRKDGQIVHASYQGYQTAEDVLYHLLYCFQHEEITVKGEIFIHASTEQQLEKAKQLSELAGSVQSLQQQKITTHFREHLLFQELCV